MCSGGGAHAPCPLLQAEWLPRVLRCCPSQTGKDSSSPRSVPPGRSDLPTETLHLPAHDRSSFFVQIRRNEYSQTPRDRDRVYLIGPSTQDGLIISPTPFPPLTPPPNVHTRVTQNPSVPVRASIASSVVSDDYAPTLRASEAIHPFGRTLVGRSNMSADMSTITLPSFVQERPITNSPTPPSPTHVATAEGAFPPLTRFSFKPSGPRIVVSNTTPPTTLPPEIDLRHDLMIPSMFAHDQLPPHHRTRPPSPRRAGVRRELATAKLKSAAQAQFVRIVQPGTRKVSERPTTTIARGDALMPLTIPTRTLSFLGDYDSPPYSHREEPDTSLAPNHPPRSISQKPPPRHGAPLALHLNNPPEPPSLHQPPILGLSNSPNSYVSLDEKRSRGTSQATSSMSTVPSISAFPSPPDLTPIRRDKVLSILSSYSTSGQPFLTSVGATETTSPNKPQASIPLSAADIPRLMTAVNPRPVLTTHQHSGFVSGRDDLLTGSEVYSRIPSMRRPPRVPLGPRKMSGGPKSPLPRISQPSPV